MSKVATEKKGIKTVSSKLLAIAAVSMMIACCLMVIDPDNTEAANPTSGTCGPSLSWSIDTSNWHLTITGTGEMTDYGSNDVRWGGYPVCSVSLPDGMTSIGEYAFAGCTSLSSVTVSNGVVSIRSNAFEGCLSLTSITIGSSVNYIRSEAFKDCPSLTSVTIPDNVTTIDTYAFEGCLSLTSITIGSGVSSLNARSFTDCPSLTSITVSYSNPNYSSSDGVVYNKTKTTLVLCPEGKTGSPFVVLPSTTAIGAYAFQNCKNIGSFVIASGTVTSIGRYAFSGCTGITSFYVSNGVTTIDDNAFDGCTSLTTVTMPSSVTSVGEYAFNDCSNLTSVTISANLTTLEYGTFVNCTSLTSITIPEGVTTISSSTFRSCNSLESITIPTSVTTLSENLSNCPKLSAVVVAEANPNYSSVDGVLFNKAKTTLLRYPANKPGTSYSVPDTVTSIGDSAFRNCSNLTSITIPASVTSMGGSVFYNCSNLTSITIPASVTSIGSLLFLDCSKMTSIDVEESNPNYTSVDGVLFNKTKTTLIEYPAGKTSSSYSIPDTVTAINGNAFYGCSGLTSIAIPASVTSIGYYAFYGCSGLTSVSIPSGVTSIANGTFQGCSNLASVSIPDTVSAIDSYAFDGCSSLTSINIPDGVTTIQSNTFCNCSKLTSITIPDTVTSIDRYAFDGCSSLTSINIPDGVTSIGNEAFRGCSKLTSIMIPASVASMNNAFRDCSDLTSVTVANSNANYCSVDGVLFNKTKTTLMLYPANKSGSSYSVPNTVTKIDNYSFYGCKNLETLSIPDSVTAIGNYALSCKKITSIEVSASNPSYTSVGGVLFSKNKDTVIKYPIARTEESFSIPATVVKIGYGSFSGAEKLSSITIPNSVIQIDDSAFSSLNKLTTVNIPANVMMIGSQVFSSCLNLSSITVSETNRMFCSENNALYSKDKTSLISCPAKYRGELKIPAQTDYINVLTDLMFCDGIERFIVENGSMFKEEGGGLFIYNYLVAYAAKYNSSSYTIKSDVITLTGTQISVFYSAENLTEILVEDGNSMYSSSGGNLYSKDGSILVTCPSGKETYQFPTNVRNTAAIAFSGMIIKEVTFPSGTDVTIGQGAFFNCQSLKKIVIEEGADVTFDLDSIMFMDDQEHTIYVVAPEGYILDTSGYNSKIKIVYGEPPSDDNGDKNNDLWIYIGAGAIVVVAVAAVAIIIIRRR